MKQKIAIFTTIFPAIEQYLDEFLKSLQGQTCKNFDLVVVNDGCDGFKKIIDEYSELSVIELKLSETPSKNREFGIRYVKRKKYDVLILADSDDYFEPNRIEVSLNYLKYCDVVVNDLSLVFGGSVYCERYLSKRVANNQKIFLDDIFDKNIFGFSNTALNVKVIDVVEMDKELVAVDWFFFSRVLLSGASAVFTNETRTYYRQWRGNTIGIDKMTCELLDRGIDVKIKHYGLMSNIDKSYIDRLQRMLKLKDMLSGPGDKKHYIDQMSKYYNQNTLWWEGIELPEDKREI